ncbi:MAG: class I SAM-dependent methyltransferase [Spirochaetaceae bacterium]
MGVLEDYLSSRDLGDYLDVACGEGEFAERLLEAAGGYRSALGVDVDEESLATARLLFEGHYGNVFFQQGDIHRLDMADASFDTVSISNALHHVRRPEAVLQELFRVLRPEGILVVNEMIRDDLAPDQENARDLHHLKARIDRLKGIDHRSTYTDGELRELLGIDGSVGGATVELEATEYPDGDDPKTIQGRLEFLEEYAELAEGTDEYGAIRKEALRLKHRISSRGFRPQPQKLYVLSRSYR